MLSLLENAKIDQTKERQGYQPQRLQILRIDKEGLIDDIIMHGT